jgi:hypothetical protein
VELRGQLWRRRGSRGQRLAPAAQRQLPGERSGALRGCAVAGRGLRLRWAPAAAEQHRGGGGRRRARARARRRSGAAGGGGGGGLSSAAGGRAGGIGAALAAHRARAGGQRLQCWAQRRRSGGAGGRECPAGGGGAAGQQRGCWGGARLAAGQGSQLWASAVRVGGSGGGGRRLAPTCCWRSCRCRALSPPQRQPLAAALRPATAPCPLWRRRSPCRPPAQAAPLPQWGRPCSSTPLLLLLLLTAAVTAGGVFVHWGIRVSPGAGVLQLRVRHRRRVCAAGQRLRRVAVERHCVRVRG